MAPPPLRVDPQPPSGGSPVAQVPEVGPEVGEEPPNPLLISGQEWRDLGNGLAPDQRHLAGFTDYQSKVHVEKVCVDPSDFSIQDAFELAFPVDFFRDMNRWTNQALHAYMPRFSFHEFLKCFGILFLKCLSNTDDMKDLWKTDDDDILPAMNVGTRFGIGKTRFESFRHFLRMNAPYDGDDRWQPVRGLVEAFNRHRLAMISPGSHLIVDESMSQWYCRDDKTPIMKETGHPHVTHIDRKPVDMGAEIKNITDEDIKVIMRIEIQEAKEAMRVKEFMDKHDHHTAVVLRLSKPWFNSRRVICGDSAFASLKTVKALLEEGLYFIGVVKQ